MSDDLTPIPDEPTVRVLTDVEQALVDDGFTILEDAPPVVTVADRPYEPGVPAEMGEPYLGTVRSVTYRMADGRPFTAYFPADAGAPPADILASLGLGEGDVIAESRTAYEVVEVPPLPPIVERKAPPTLEDRG